MKHPDLLALKGLSTLDINDVGDHYRIVASGTVIPEKCPVCHSSLYGHGSQRQSYMDTPMHGKRVLIEIDRKRYRCKSCGKTLFEPLSVMDDKRLMTTRLVRYIESHCLRKTFADLSREIGVDDKTIRHIFDDHVASLKATVHFETPEVLGIDELKIIGQYRAMITNVQKLTLYDMLPSRTKADLIPYFKKMPDKERVKILTMDLWSVYRQVAQAQFPGRVIVADRFHVVRMANEAIERFRKALRKGLDTKTRLKLKDDRFILLARRQNLSPSQLQTLERWTQEFPVLGAAYEAKEAFHGIYGHRDKADAIEAAKRWEQTIDPAADWAFRELKGALHSWWDEIFNYYDHPVSNAYTESINNVAKGMNRMGRGYSFEVIRARLLYDKKAREAGSETVRKKGRKSGGGLPPGFVGYSDLAAEDDQDAKVIEYGAHLPTLARLLEEGHFA